MPQKKTSHSRPPKKGKGGGAASLESLPCHQKKGSEEVRVRLHYVAPGSLAEDSATGGSASRGQSQRCLRPGETGLRRNAEPPRGELHELGEELLVADRGGAPAGETISVGRKGARLCPASNDGDGRLDPRWEDGLFLPHVDLLDPCRPLRRLQLLRHLVLVREAHPHKHWVHHAPPP